MNPIRSEEIRSCILKQVTARGADKTICPSEVARELGGEEWRSWMEPVRAIAADLMEQGKIVVTQRGNPVHPQTAKGPIRLRLASDQRD
jgi:hypothetical protein